MPGSIGGPVGAGGGITNVIANVANVAALVPGLLAAGQQSMLAYVGTNRLVYRTVNGGTTWTPLIMRAFCDNPTSQAAMTEMVDRQELFVQSNGTSHMWNAALPTSGAWQLIHDPNPGGGSAPVFTTHPSNVSAASGGTATFTVVATGATSYQWQRNTGTGWTNLANGGAIAGVTTTSLTINPLAGTDNNHQFRCVATGLGGTTNSNAATLTVSVTFPLTNASFRTTAGNAFLDAGVTPTTLMGQKIQQLNDLSGNNNHVTQLTSANRPIFVPSDPFTGRPAFRTTGQGGGGYWFQAPNVSIDTRNFSFFLIGRPCAQGSDDNALFSFGSTGALSSPMIDIENGVFRSYLPLNSAANSHLYANPLVIVVVGTPTAINIYRNNTKFTLPAYNAGTVTAGRILHRGDGYPFVRMHGYELGVFASQLSDTDVASLVTYATSQYGLRTSWTNLLAMSGDSLAAGQQDDVGLGNTWPTMVANQIGPTWKYADSSEPSFTLQKLNTYAPWSTDVHLTGVTGRKIYVQCGGTNDIGVDGVSLATLKTRAETIVNNRKTAGFNEVYLGTIANRDGSAGWDSTKETIRTDYNAWLLTQVGTLINGVIPIAANAAFSNSSNATYYDTDKLHWKQAARDIVRDLVIAAINP